MISGDFSHCTTLEQFYAEIEALHRTAHGAGYTSHHKDLIDLMGDCQSYRELGINQGATAAAVMLQAPKYIELIDLVTAPFRKHEHLFQKFATENDVAMAVVESSSIDPKLSVVPVDMLLIDTVHEPQFVVKELEKHAQFVNKYIIIHDTGTFPSIHEAAHNYLIARDWQVLKWDRRGCGHSIFKKV